MTARLWGVAAFLMAAAAEQGASAATMQTVFTGWTTEMSTDASSFFGNGVEPGNIGFWPVEISVIWNTEPTALDPVQTTLNLDAGSSSFRAQADSAIPTGVSELNILVGTAATNFVNQVTYFGWSRANNPATGTAALTFSIGGLLTDGKPFDFIAQYSAIPGALPLARDAAFSVATASFLGATSSFRIIDTDGQSVTAATFDVLDVSTINLDKPIDPAPADVPLPGAALLLVSGLAAMAGTRFRWRSNRIFE